jgi:hypothetical protein
MRKLALLSLAIVFALSIVGMASAASLTANTTQKGSLLFWPKIFAFHFEGATEVVPNIFGDTVVFIGNDDTKQACIHCYWMYPDQTFEDFEFCLSPNQPVAFSATLGLGDFIFSPPITVPPFEADFGALFCWAVDAGDQNPVVENHLYGSALLVSGDFAIDTGLDIDIEGTVLYNAYAFVGKASLGTDSTQLLLNGQVVTTAGGPVVYDACPTYLVENFVPLGGVRLSSTSQLEPELTLVPCKQDLRQERTGTWTKAKFDVWNANETKFTGAYKCIKCWAEFDFVDIDSTAWAGNVGPGFGEDKFDIFTLKSLAARFRVQGVKSDGVCLHSTVASPLLGLILYREETIYHSHGAYYAGQTLHGAGADPSGFFYWDPNGSPLESGGK